jgi:hypothetical protein
MHKRRSALEQISKRRSRPSNALYVLWYTAGRRLNGYDVRKSALGKHSATVRLHATRRTVSGENA